MFKKYLLNLLLLLDISVNVIIFGGSPYETISSRAGKRAVRGEVWACRLCKLLDRLLGPEHCRVSEVPDYGKTLPVPFMYRLAILVVVISLFFL